MENNIAQQKEFDVGDIIYCEDLPEWYMTIAVVLARRGRAAWTSYDLFYLHIDCGGRYDRIKNRVDSDALQHLNVLV